MSEKKYCHDTANCEYYNSWPDYIYDLIEKKCQFCEHYHTLEESANAG